MIGLTDGLERWISTTGQVRFAGGRPVRLTGLAMDVTARKRGRPAQRLLMREVDHRAKNALAVVQAALRLTGPKRRADLCGSSGPGRRSCPRPDHPRPAAVEGADTPCWKASWPPSSRGEAGCTAGGARRPAGDGRRAAAALHGGA